VRHLGEESALGLIGALGLQPRLHQRRHLADVDEAPTTVGEAIGDDAEVPKFAVFLHVESFLAVAVALENLADHQLHVHAVEEIDQRTPDRHFGILDVRQLGHRFADVAHAVHVVDQRGDVGRGRHQGGERLLGHRRTPVLVGGETRQHQEQEHGEKRQSPFHRDAIRGHVRPEQRHFGQHQRQHEGIGGDYQPNQGVVVAIDGADAAHADDADEEIKLPTHQDIAAHEGNQRHERNQEGHGRHPLDQAHHHRHRQNHRQAGEKQQKDVTPHFFPNVIRQADVDENQGAEKRKQVGGAVVTTLVVITQMPLQIGHRRQDDEQQGERHDERQQQHVIVAAFDHPLQMQRQGGEGAENHQPHRPGEIVVARILAYSHRHDRFPSTPSGEMTFTADGLTSTVRCLS